MLSKARLYQILIERLLCDKLIISIVLCLLLLLDMLCILKCIYYYTHLYSSNDSKIKKRLLELKQETKTNKQTKRQRGSHNYQKLQLSVIYIKKRRMNYITQYVPQRHLCYIKFN